MNREMLTDSDISLLKKGITHFIMTTQPQQVYITTPYIELYKLLKRENLVASGGEAKFVISEGMIRVNGEIETRKRKKIAQGDLVVFGETSLVVAHD